MQLTTNRYFPDFFRQPYAEVERIWRELIVAKERLLALNIPVMPRIYNYIDAVYERIMSLGANDVEGKVDQTVIRFLDIPLAREFMAHPEVLGIRNAFSEELVFIAAGLGYLVEPAEPYSASELTAIINGDTRFVDEMIFLYTLRAIARGYEVETLAPVLMFALAAEEPDSPPVFYEWSGALSFTLILHALWRFFGFLQASDQARLLNYYFYQAIVAGVPVRERLRQAIDLSGADAAIEQKYFVDTLFKNQELVAIKTADGGWESLTKIFNRFVASGGRSHSSFAQEKFVSDLYEQQPGRDAYALWLREAINVMIHVRSGDI